MPDISLLLILVVVFALIFDVTNGFHDAANAIAAVVGTRVLTPGIAIAMAAVMEFAGALFSTNVAKTIAGGLVAPGALVQEAVLAAVLGAIAWNIITWYFGMPSSSTHALVGGLIGATLISAGPGVVIWWGLLKKVIIPMFTSPIIGGLLGLFILAIFYICFRWMKQRQANAFFPRMQIVTAAVMAFAHGTSDAQKSMGIITMALVVGGILAPGSNVPMWVIIACAAAICMGTAMGGRRIIKTMGNNIVRLEPVHGTAAQIAAASTILTTAMLAMPVSTTHVISGSIFGVGLGKPAKGVRWHVAGHMAIAWLMTVPASACVAAIIYLAIKAVMKIGG